MRKIQVDDELNAEVNLLELSLSATGLALPLIGAEIDPEGGNVLCSRGRNNRLCLICLKTIVCMVACTTRG